MNESSVKKKVLKTWIDEYKVPPSVIFAFYSNLEFSWTMVLKIILLTIISYHFAGFVIIFDRKVQYNLVVYF